MIKKTPKHKTLVNRPLTHATHRQSDPLITHINVRGNMVIRIPPTLSLKIAAKARKYNMSIADFITSSIFPSGDIA